MNQQITLTVSDNVMFYAKVVAKQNKRRVEEVLSDLLEKISSEIIVEQLADSEVLALADLKMSAEQQEILHNLLDKNGEGKLTNAEKKQLDAMMEIYDDALLRKAQAMRVAVERGLMPPLSAE